MPSTKKNILVQTPVERPNMIFWSVLRTDLPNHYASNNIDRFHENLSFFTSFSFTSVVARYKTSETRDKLVWAKVNAKVLFMYQKYFGSEFPLGPNEFSSN